MDNVTTKPFAVVSASLKTKAQGRGGRFMPDSAKAEMHRKMAEPGSAKEKTPKK